MAIFLSLLPLFESLGKIAVEYATASEERRAQLVAEADDAFAKCKATVLGLAAAVSDADAAADAIANAKPSAVATTAEAKTTP